MNRLLFALPAAIFLFATVPATAAPRPDDKPSGPAIIGQAKSFNDLLDMTKAMVKTIGGDALYKEFEKNALQDLDPKKLPGIDPKRPFGLYGIVNGKFEDCRGVLLIPVSSEKEFIDMLGEYKIDIAKSDKEAGVYDVATPEDFPIHVSFRVHKGYAYVALGGSDVISAKTILDPKDVINEKEKASIFLSLRFDRIAADAKKSLLAIIRDQLEQLKEQIPEVELKEAKEAFHAAEKLAMRYLKMLFDEGKELAIRVDADVKTGELFADITVEGMPKSPLAETFAKRQKNMNAFASLAGDDFAQRIFITAPFFADEAREAYVKLIDWGNKEMIRAVGRGNTPPESLGLVDAIFKSLKATVESGEMDLAAAIRGPNKEGFYTAVGAVHCKEGAQLEKAIREAVKILPEPEKSYFKFEAGKIDGVVIHEIDMSAEAGEIVKKIFGKGQTAYFGFGKNALYAAYGPDGMKLMKEAINAKPGPAAVLDTTSDPKKAKDLFAKIMPPGDPNGPGMSLGWLESATSGLKITVEGGDKLRIRVSYNMGTLMFFFMGRNAAAGAQFQQVKPLK